MQPAEIEARSFAIIDQETGNHSFTSQEWTIVRRMIHTSADFDYRQNVRFHPQAIAAGMNVLRQGGKIITDTRMAFSGIRQRDLSRFGVTLHCLIDDPNVREKAETQGITRSKAAVDAACPLMEGGIYVIGNAPTALLRLMELIKAGLAAPALVIGVPVGFVNAAESKEALSRMDYPHITSLGRKGGSNVAAAVVNGLGIMMNDE